MQTDADQEEKDSVSEQHASGAESSSFTESAASSQLELLVQLFESGKVWVRDLSGLAALELERSITAIARIALLRIYLIPLVVVFYITLSIASGWIAYDLSRSALIGALIPLALQLLVIVGVRITINKIRPLIGFNKTKQEIEAFIGEVNYSFKQTGEKPEPTGTAGSSNYH